MKVPFSWLREYVSVSLSASEIAQRLTMAGVEANLTKATRQSWDKITVGQIMALEPHPNADRLQLATIDFGQGQSKVVCGATNVRIGDKVPFAQVGAELVDGHSGKPVRLKPAKIRGVASEGMACSEKELGISESHEGVLVLPADAPLGIPLADYLADAVLDLEVTPNRPDCLSILGVAREVAALTKQEMRLPSSSYEEAGPEIQKRVSVEIADPDLCRRYCASLTEGIKIGPSPAWMQQRLTASGMRPINNIVDITNYVMLEYGQPLHAFDFRKIGGARIVVRRARAGEKLTSLDGVDRELRPDMLVIADQSIPVAIAGVMGGADSEVTEVTTSVLLESANFNQVSIRRTSSGLKMRSEASMRFERGISPELTVPALWRATQLMLEIAGGTASKGMADVYPGKKEAKVIRLRTAYVMQLLGLEVSQEQIIDVLVSLGFQCVPAGSENTAVTIPYWRTDVSEPADLSEEVARILGYAAIPTTTLSSELPRQQVDTRLSFREQLRDLMVAAGFQEIITYSLTSQHKLTKAASAENAVHVANPLSTELEYLRTSLRPGLLTTLAANQKYEEGGIRLFEIGRVFLGRGSDLPDEREILGGVVSGPRGELSWFGEKGQSDFFDAKGAVESVLSRLGIEAEYEAGGEDKLRSGRVARVVVGQTTVGIIGEIHPRVAESFDLLPQSVALFELDIENLLSVAKEKQGYHPLSRFPRSVRDIAVLVDVQVPAKKMLGVVRSVPLVSQVSLFDLYSGRQVPVGKKSVAFRIAYQSDSHTLTEEELETTENEILDRLAKDVGAARRG
ncbi:MAG: phenylalanine--tRNA ligase subunit beta [Dehalococcoidia bacterium]|nr:phenylalanine--tRNA ligase subunit beta [Dehalococcoidia bacterium]